MAFGIVSHADKSFTLIYKHLEHFFLAVDIVIISVSGIRDFFHHGIVQVVESESKACHVDAFRSVLLHHLDQRLIIGDTHIEITVGAHDNPVVVFWIVVGQSLFVCHYQCFATCRVTISVEFFDGFLYFVFLTHRCRFQYFLHFSRISDNRDTVVGIQVVDKADKSRLQQIDFILRAHRPRHIHQKDEVRLWHLIGFQFLALDTESQQFVVSIPGA